MGPELILAGTGLALGAASSAASAIQANKNAEAQAEAANRNALARQQAQQNAATVKAKQLQAQGEVEKQKVSSQAHLIASKLRAAAGEAGIAGGGTFNALLRQTGLDAFTESSIIDQNTALGIEAAASTIQPLQSFVAPRTDVLFPALTGGFQGMATGLNIAANIWGNKKNG